ncbi:MAG TPA: LysR family transcriptional regulator [Gammaproteobacteria bacterium]|nr:LysR family transcriptional regulator [Gammaproteobacteria bacterium]
METRWLRYFVAVYEAGSLSAAARRLFVAQPSISTTLARLEEHLGAPLFVRHRKGITATPEGREVYATATRLLGEMKALEGRYRLDAPDEVLSLAVTPSVSGRRLVPLLQRLQDAEEAVALRLVEAGEDADARIVSDWECGGDEAFVPLWEERYVLALPAGHPLVLSASIRVADLAGAALVERCHCELKGEVGRALDRLSAAPQVVARAQNEEWAAALVEAGVGVAVLPEGSVGEHPGIVLRELADLSLKRRMGLAHRPDRPASRALRRAVATARALSQEARAAS